MGRNLPLRVMQGYWRLTRSATLGAQGVVLDAQDRVLLVRHGYRPGWHFPGGGVDRNEHIGLALRRELLEETGVIVEAEPRLVGVFANFRAFPSDHVVLFEVRSWRQPVRPEPNHEITEIGFFDRRGLPDGTVGAVHRRLREMFEGQAQSPDW